MPNQIEIDAYYHMLAYEEESDYEESNNNSDGYFLSLCLWLNLTKKWTINQKIEWRREKYVTNLSKNENRQRP